MKPHTLRVDHGGQTLGTTEPRPRLSWLLPDGVREQTAWNLHVGEWDSGWIERPDSVAVTYAGPPLRARQQIAWKVRVRTDLGESAWSDEAAFEMGLLSVDDWSARFIGPAEDTVSPSGSRPAHLLRRSFTLATPSISARIYATAHGIYELFANGHRVGDQELSPGFTSYRSHLDVQTYDVGDLLGAGDNTICAVLSDGWYRGQTGFQRMPDGFGTRTALLVQLEARLADDTRAVIVTDADWESTTGPIVAADLMAGQRVDLLAEPNGWRPVEVIDADLNRLSTSPAPPVRRIEALAPVSIDELGPGHHVVDLGQNINGAVTLEDLGPAGTAIVLTHGERLDADGDVDVEHLQMPDYITGEILDAGQVDEVIASGREGERFEPRHTTHGFQYVRIEGHPGPIELDDVRGIVVHTDLRRTGWFTCSDDRINRLHDAAVWSFRDNACDVPTDCPQRERAAWTGDWQVFAPTAAFLYDVAGFSAKWLRSLADDQWPDGRIPNFVPDPTGPDGHDHPMAQFITGSAGWGDAAVIVPWEMWVAYGDLRFLERSYESMVRWVGFAEERARTGRHATRVARSAEPATHERHLWDSGFHWGEWCEPGGNPDGLFTLEADVGDVATAYLCRSADLLSRVAGLLDHDADAARFATLAEEVRVAWQTEFTDDAGHVRPRTQANLVRALAFGLVDDAKRSAIAAELVALVREAGTHVGTGFLATPFLLPVLADTGHADIAFELLLQDSPPSWLAMIDRGATTIWENWEGLDAGGKGSLNHYSKGAVVSFLHRYVAGIRPDEHSPGYRHFRVEPILGGGLTSAEATLESPYGRIRSSWRVEDGTVRFEVDVPPGTTADIALPDGTSQTVGPGPFRAMMSTPIDHARPDRTLPGAAT